MIAPHREVKGSCHCFSSEFRRRVSTYVKKIPRQDFIRKRDESFARLSKQCCISFHGIATTKLGEKERAIKNRAAVFNCPSSKSETVWSKEKESLFFLFLALLPG